MDERKKETVIAAEVEITGTIKSKGTLEVDGKVDGELLCDQDAVIGKDAVIKGNITAQSVSVEGTIEGNITARDRVELKGTARITGDLKGKRLVVQDGVSFIGRSDVNPAGGPGGARASAPAAKPAPAEELSPAASPNTAKEPGAATPAKEKEKESDERDVRSGIFGRR